MFLCTGIFCRRGGRGGCGCSSTLGFSVVYWLCLTIALWFQEAPQLVRVCFANLKTGQWKCLLVVLPGTLFPVLFQSRNGVHVLKWLLVYLVL